MLASRIEAATGCRQLYIGAGREEDWKPLTPDDVSDNEPAFSPDGRRIAVHARDVLGDSLGIWIIDAATGQRSQLTNRGMSPQWTRDGKRIYFRRRDDANEWVSEIWVIEPAGGAPKLVLKNAGRFRLINGMAGAIADEGGI
jgi:Tol biopolymer transport system component